MTTPGTFAWAYISESDLSILQLSLFWATEELSEREFQTVLGARKTVAIDLNAAIMDARRGSTTVDGGEACVSKWEPPAMEGLEDLRQFTTDELAELLAAEVAEHSRRIASARNTISDVIAKRRARRIVRQILHRSDGVSRLTQMLTLGDPRIAIYVAQFWPYAPRAEVEARLVRISETHDDQYFRDAARNVLTARREVWEILGPAYDRRATEAANGMAVEEVSPPQRKPPVGFRKSGEYISLGLPIPDLRLLLMCLIELTAHVPDEEYSALVGVDKQYAAELYGRLRSLVR